MFWVELMWWFGLVWLWVADVDSEYGWDESLAVWCGPSRLKVTLVSSNPLLFHSQSHSQNTKDNSLEALS